MACNHSFEQLGAYLDGELSSADATAVQLQIATCNDCAAHVAELVAMRRALRPARAQFAPSAAFRAKMQSQLKAKPARRSWTIWLVPAFSAVAAAVFCFSFLFHTQSKDAFSEVADLHISALASTNPVDVVSTDRHTVKPWFQGRIPFSFNLPEFAGTEFNLVGGRAVYLHQSPGAHLIVGVRQHRISVFIFAASADGLPTYTNTANRNAFSEATWQSKGLRFVVIGDADQGEITRLADAFKQANP